MNKQEQESTENTAYTQTHTQREKQTHTELHIPHGPCADSRRLRSVEQLRLFVLCYAETQTKQHCVCHCSTTSTSTLLLRCVYGGEILTDHVIKLNYVTVDMHTCLQTPGEKTSCSVLPKGTFFQLRAPNVLT